MHSASLSPRCTHKGHAGHCSYYAVLTPAPSSYLHSAFTRVKQSCLCVGSAGHGTVDMGSRQGQRQINLPHSWQPCYRKQTFFFQGPGRVSLFLEPFSRLGVSAEERPMTRKPDPKSMQCQGPTRVIPSHSTEQDVCLVPTRQEIKSIVCGLNIQRQHSLVAGAAWLQTLAVPLTDYVTWGK